GSGRAASTRRRLKPYWAVLRQVRSDIMRKVSARLTIRDIQKMKAQGQPIAMLTAYDAVTARLAEAAGVPMLLVGDTLGIMVQGHESTVPVTLDHVVYHSEKIGRAHV